MKLIDREMRGALERTARYFPVVTLLGPRQSGKTTLARMAFPLHSYANLEERTARMLAEEDPASFFKRYPPPVIVDEVQRVPSLLSEIQVRADAEGGKGRYILTGSHQPALHEGISQSLAGRTGILRLLPLSLGELADAGAAPERDEAVFRGFLPRHWAEGVPPEMLYPAYYATYVERDVRQLVHLRDQNAFETFLRLLAGRVGQVANLHALSDDIGVSGQTLKAWLSVLEASFVVWRLPCYFENFGKRLAKAPKIYFTDVGLAASLLGIENARQAGSHPLLGGLFENLVVMEALKARWNAGKAVAGLYYYRVQGRNEVDLILDGGGSRVPVEIKAGRTPHPGFAGELRKFMAVAEGFERPTVVYGGEEELEVKGVRFVGFRHFRG